MTGQTKDTSSSMPPWLWPLLFVAVPSVVFSLPFFIWPFPPFQDYPNHLLEGHILAFPHAYERWVSITWLPVPNLTVQLVLAVLQHVVGMRLSGVLVSVSIVILFTSGAYRAMRTMFRSPGPVVLVPLLWVWSYFFWRGYLNFTLGCALFLWGIYLFDKYRDNRKAFSIPLMIVWSLLLYTTHIFPWALWLSWILLDDAAAKRFPRVSSVLATVSGLILFAIYAVFSSDGDTAWYYGTGIWKVSAIKRTMGVPFVSCLRGTGVITLLTLENAVRYLLVVLSVAYLAFKLGFSRIMPDSGRKSFGPVASRVSAEGVSPENLKSKKSATVPLARILWYALWLAAYLVLPTYRGIAEVDTRVLFLPLLLMTCEAVSLGSASPVFHRILWYVLATTLVLQMVTAWSQFRIGSQEISRRMTMTPSQTRAGRFSHAFPIMITTPQTLQHALAHRLFEKVKLHTDEGQVSVVDLHITCYLYENPQTAPPYAPGIFATSVLKVKGGGLP